MTAADASERDRGFDLVGSRWGSPAAASSGRSASGSQLRHVARRSRTCRGRPRRCACCAAAARSRSRAISGLPSVTECTSVVAPPTSTTTRSPTRLGEQLGGDEHRAGRRAGCVPVTNCADALHARRVRDVLLERVVDDGRAPARCRARRRRGRRCAVTRTRKPAASSSSWRLGADHRVAAVDDDRPRRAAPRDARRCTARSRSPRPRRRRRAGSGSGATSSMRRRSASRSRPAVWYSTTPPAPSAASRAAIAVIFAVRPCTVMRSPPAADDVASVSVGLERTRSCLELRARRLADRCRTSPCATDVGATPWPRSPGARRRPAGEPVERRDRRSSSSRSRRRARRCGERLGAHRGSHPPLAHRLAR